MASPQPASPPRRSRGFSNRSGQSQDSGKSNKGHTRGFSESSEEKARHNLHTKADPLVAMNELQPMAVALEKSNLGSLRDVQHKDQYGNLITEPDLSNPTRPRFERPLDTIRSFEAAIYGTYSNNREDAASQMGDFSRRTSYYGGQNGNRGPRYDQNNYGQNQSRPDSIVNAYQNAPQSLEQPNPYPYNQNGQQNGRRRPHHPRASPSFPITPTEGYPNVGSNISNSQYGYPQGHGYQRSYDNVTALSNTGSGHTDPYGQSTDPSSINSSNDQLQQQALQQQRLDERAQAEYGFNGFGPSKAVQPVGDPNWGGPVGAPAASGAGPAAAQPNHLRKNTNQSEQGDKRKSWFKRRFSKD